MGLLQAPGTGFALATAVSLLWIAKTRHIKNRGMGGALALGGHRLVKKSNNQQTVGGNNERDDREGAQLGWRVWGSIVSLCRAAEQCKKYKKKMSWP
jgi:hypothetical protein